MVCHQHCLLCSLITLHFQLRCVYVGLNISKWNECGCESVRGLYQQLKRPWGLNGSFLCVTTGKICIHEKAMDRLSAWAQIHEGSTLCMCRYMQVCMGLSHYQTLLIIRHWVEWKEAVGAVWASVSADCIWDIFTYVWYKCPNVCICGTCLCLNACLLWILALQLFQIMRFCNLLNLETTVCAGRYEKHNKIIALGAHIYESRLTSKETNWEAKHF